MKKIFQATTCLSQEELILYSNGDVSDELRYKIENHLLDCPLCTEALEGVNLMSESDSNLNELYNRIDQKRESGSNPSQKRIIPWNRIAAGILFLLTFGAALIYYQNNNSNKFQAYFQQSNESFASRAIDESRFSADLDAGQRLFKKGNHQGSYSFFDDYLTTNPESSIAAYYAGVSAFEIGELDTSIDLLTQVRLNDEQLYEEATWMLAGVYLEKGDDEKAKDLLEEIVQGTGSFYSERAAELLKEIR